jgi:hypothetical protein
LEGRRTRFDPSYERDQSAHPGGIHKAEHNSRKRKHVGAAVLGDNEILTTIHNPFNRNELQNFPAKNEKPLDKIPSPPLQSPPRGQQKLKTQTQNSNSKQIE